MNQVVCSNIVIGVLFLRLMVAFPSTTLVRPTGKKTPIHTRTENARENQRGTYYFSLLSTVESNDILETRLLQRVDVHQDSGCLCGELCGIGLQPQSKFTILQSASSVHTPRVTTRVRMLIDMKKDNARGMVLD